MMKPGETAFSKEVFTIADPELVAQAEQEGATVAELKSRKARENGETIARKAIEEAGQIAADLLTKAQAERDAILSQAKLDAEQIKQQAYEQGIQDGVSAEREAISALVERLEMTVGRIEGEQAGLAIEYEQNLKWLALEIAARVMSKRLEEDDAFMAELITEAVRTLKNADWISVELSGEMTGLIDQFSGELRKLGNERITIRGITAPAGTCLVDTPQERIDASIYTQLENLKDYFRQEQS